MEKEKFKKRYLLLIFPILAGILLFIAVLTSSEDFLTKILHMNELRAYFLLGCLILLPVILIIFSFYLQHRSKREKQEFLRAPLPQEQGELKKEEGKGEDSRFFMLSKTDQEMERKPRKNQTEELTLKELCHKFRHYAAGQLKLYYSEGDIREFISGLAVSHILVMQGMSGTGKTSLAYAFGEFLQNKSTIVPIQPMWKERTDLIGYYNEFTKKFNETVLLQKMYEANYSEDIYITVLDEMNIARVEYYFAEFLSLLEIPNPEGRYLDVVTDKKNKDPKLLKDGRLKLPTNMWFIGTANNDDSTFAISDKVYDRAMIMNLDKKSEWFDAEESKPINLTANYFDKLVKRAIGEYKLTSRNRKRIKKLDEYMVETFHLTFGNRIMKQINQYVPVMLACGGEEVEAIDDILSKKVLRKLESQNPIYVRNAADGLKTYLDELFGQDKMPKCKAYLTHLERNA